MTIRMRSFWRRGGVAGLVLLASAATTAARSR